MSSRVRRTGRVLVEYHLSRHQEVSRDPNEPIRALYSTHVTFTSQSGALKGYLWALTSSLADARHPFPVSLRASNLNLSSYKLRGYSDDQQKGTADTSRS